MLSDVSAVRSRMLQYQRSAKTTSVGTVSRELGNLSRHLIIFQDVITIEDGCPPDVA
jgi:hypothetical protein